MRPPLTAPASTITKAVSSAYPDAAVKRPLALLAVSLPITNVSSFVPPEPRGWFPETSSTF